LLYSFTLGTNEKIHTKCWAPATYKEKPMDSRKEVLSFSLFMLLSLVVFLRNSPPLIYHPSEDGNALLRKENAHLFQSHPYLSGISPDQ
jgi:hypothetical protein